MSFDKVKTMRNAERFLAQGKIRAAIGEYRQIVENDPRDFSTLNILGDLYVKDTNQDQAVECFRLVAEYYGNQGFAQKAIAIYNKISRLQPGSVEISVKLAELYQSRGSLVEARAHYSSVAEYFDQEGCKAEALEIWKKIAELDPHDTNIYLRIAETCTQEQQYEEAVKAFLEAGQRLARNDQHEAAVLAYSKALEINPGEAFAVNGLVKSQISLGYADEAAKSLEELHEKEPYNKEIIYLLADCYLDLNKASEAEKVIVKLVEREPANYPKLLELLDIYLKENDLSSATRILSMTAEQLMVGGQAEEYLKWLAEILTRNPENLDALRLLVNFRSWERDESQMKAALERLAEAARLNEAIEEERYALTQLVLLVPQARDFAERLQVLNAEHGYADVEPLIAKAPEQNGFSEAAPMYENFAMLSSAEEGGERAASSFESFENYYSEENGFSRFEAVEVAANAVNGSNGFSVATEIVEDAFPQTDWQFSSAEAEDFPPHSAADGQRIEQELESIEFYISQGYRDLARKSLDALEEEFGSHPRIESLRDQLNDMLPAAAASDFPAADDFEPEIIEEAKAPEFPVFEEVGVAAETYDAFNDFKFDLGLEEEVGAAPDSGDYDTHYQMAIAYKEMGLMEDAIKEFQDAINLAAINDGTRRFFQCANLLGHCFMEKQMPHLALLWYQRALDTDDLNDEERHALLYEIGSTYEAGGDREKAIEAFEQIYAGDVGYRNITDRLDNLRIDQPA